MTATDTVTRLVEDGIIDEIIQRVKTGKEAEVFVVRRRDEFLAAKVYKERTQRNFKNDAGYKEGRAVRNSRDMRALAKGTRYGLELSETEWMSAEHDAMVKAIAAGVRVPKPELFYEGVLLMELVLDSDGKPAPRMSEITPTREEAVEWYREIVSSAVKLLTCDLIHGDLSAFNILLAWDGPTIIDMPQVVKAAHNSQAERYLVRDIRNVTEHFARYAPELKRRTNDGLLIWQKYEKRELTPEYFPEEGERLPDRRAPEMRSDRPRKGRPADRAVATGLISAQELKAALSIKAPKQQPAPAGPPSGQKQHGHKPHAPRPPGQKPHEPASPAHGKPHAPAHAQARPNAPAHAKPHAHTPAHPQARPHVQAKPHAPAKPNGAHPPPARDARPASRPGAPPPRPPQVERVNRPLAPVGGGGSASNHPSSARFRRPRPPRPA
jgi:RIO kinase 1